jgi:hypothetical protein
LAGSRGRTAPQILLLVYGLRLSEDAPDLTAGLCSGVGQGIVRVGRMMEESRANAIPAGAVAYSRPQRRLLRPMAPTMWPQRAHQPRPTSFPPTLTGHCPGSRGSRTRRRRAIFIAGDPAGRAGGASPSRGRPEWSRMCGDARSRTCRRRSTIQRSSSGTARADLI